jgi:hypothetical protein
MTPRQTWGLNIIETGELTKILFGCHIIRFSGVEFGGERAEEETFAAYGDTGAPMAGWFDEVNAFESGVCL